MACSLHVVLALSACQLLALSLETGQTPTTPNDRRMVSHASSTVDNKTSFRILFYGMTGFHWTHDSMIPYAAKVALDEGLLEDVIPNWRDFSVELIQTKNLFSAETASLALPDLIGDHIIQASSSSTSDSEEADESVAEDDGCKDIISDNPMCTFGGQCECSEIIKENPCGSTIVSAMGNTVVNDICQQTCGVGICGCKDEVADSPMCTFGQKCDCASVIKDDPCGTVIKGAFGDTVVNDLCKKTCGVGICGCKDEVADSPMCTFGQKCDCASVIKDDPCGTTIKGAFGDTVVNDLCKQTCGVCGGRRLGNVFPSPVQLGGRPHLGNGISSSPRAAGERRLSGHVAGPTTRKLSGSLTALIGNLDDVTKVFASATGIFQLPHVSNAPSETLSEKSYFPFFARTVSPLSFSGAAYAEFCYHFGWRRIFVIEKDGESGQTIDAQMVDGFRKKFAQLNATNRVDTDRSINSLREYMNVENRSQILVNIGNHRDKFKAWAEGIAVQEPRIIYFAFGADGGDWRNALVLHFLDEAGLIGKHDDGSYIYLFTNKHQAGDLHPALWDDSGNNPSHPEYSSMKNYLMKTMQRIQPNNSLWDSPHERLSTKLRGSLSIYSQVVGNSFYGAAWKKLWTDMTATKLKKAGSWWGYSDVFSPTEAVPYMRSERAFFDCLLDADKIPNAETLPFYDAAVMIFVAIGKLLKQGHKPADVYGRKLLDTILETEFEGVTGHVKLTKEGDRLHPFLLKQLQPGPDVLFPIVNTTYVTVASFSPLTRNISFEGFASLRWPVARDRLFEAHIEKQDKPGTNLTSARQTPSDRRPSCDRGTEYISRQLKCQPCQPGFYNQAFDSKCLPCNAGRFANGTKFTDCVACDPGYFASEKASAKCKPCPGGYSFGADKLGAKMCNACPSGMYSSQAAQSECFFCPKGNYSAKTGSSSCETCDQAAGKTTESRGAVSAAQCNCPRGTMEEDDGLLACQPCLEGMLCAGGGQAPITKAGYFAETQENLPEEAFAGVERKYSVFKCALDARMCPSGPPGTCALGREGIGCAECKAGMVAADDGSCEECKGRDTFPFVVTLAFVFLMIVLLYYVIDNENRAAQPKSFLLIGIVAGMMITVIQQMGVFSTIAIPWADPVKTVLKVMELLNFDIEILRMGCVMTLSYFEKFCCRLGAILVALACVVPIHTGFCFVRAARGGQGLWARFKEKMPSLVGVIGSIFMVFQISIVNTGIQPIQCQDNPNALQTVRRFPSIICWEMDEHKAMVLLGCFFLLIPLGFVAGCSWCVYNFPKRVQALDTAFLHTFAFLFFRFKPEAYWFAVVFILRNLLIALAPTLPDPITQVFSIVCILMIWNALSARHYPWRGEKANYLDTFIVSLTVMMLSISGFFVMDADPFVVAVICSSIVITIFVLMLGLILSAIWPHLVRMKVAFGYFICHHKGGKGAFARLLKVVLTEGSNQKVFIDCDDLKNLDKLFDYVGSHTETFVALLSKEILFRPWCVGELVTAHLHQPRVKIVPVVFPEYTVPDINFIQDYNSYVDVSDLGAHGIDTKMVQAMMRWLSALPTLTIPSMLTDVLMREIKIVITMDNFAGKVLSQESKEDLGPRLTTSTKSWWTSHLSQEAETKVAIVADGMNMESLATGLVLAKLVGKLTTHEASSMPKFLPIGMTLPSITECCIFILTNGVFNSPQYILSLLEAAELKTSCIPIFAEEGFRFPDKIMYQEIESNLPRLLARMTSPEPGEAVRLKDLEPRVAIDVIQDLAKEIAVVFAPQDYSSTETLLQLKAKELATRLLDKDCQALALRRQSYRNQERQISGESRRSKESKQSKDSQDTEEDIEEDVPSEGHALHGATPRGDTKGVMQRNATPQVNQILL